MKRMLAACLLLVLPLISVAAQGDKFAEGINYQLVLPPQPTTAPKGKVEVVELFWYGCPHCYHLEPYLENWLKHKPENVVFRRVPAIFGNKMWRLHAQTFYTAQVLGVEQKMTPLLFDAIHKEHRDLDSVDKLAEFFAENGVPADKFRQAFNSFAVQVKTGQAADLTRRYGIDGVPSMIVAGKYRTSATLAAADRSGSQESPNERLLEVVDFLVKKAAAE